VAVLGGREGMPRSLGSVYGGAVTRFLGGALRGVAHRVIYTPTCGVAVSRDGATLLVSVGADCSDTIHEFHTTDRSICRVIGGEGDGPLEFNEPRQVCIAADGFVFVADCGNNRVQVLTPTLDFHCFIGQRRLTSPVGVCASADVVVVANSAARRIAVFNRCDGALVRRFGCLGSSDGELKTPCDLCLVSGDRHVAVADYGNERVSVFTVGGEFVRHVGVGVLRSPEGVAASASDELVVADTGNRCLRVFSSTGDLLASFSEGRFTGVAVHGSGVFAANESVHTVTFFA
jgi:tripartite motif-containing protein 2/3